MQSLIFKHVPTFDIMNQTNAIPYWYSYNYWHYGWNDPWYYDTYYSPDFSYFVFLLILFICVYIVLASFMCKSRFACENSYDCQEKHYVHYVVVDPAPNQAQIQRGIPVHQGSTSMNSHS